MQIDAIRLHYPDETRIIIIEQIHPSQFSAGDACDVWRIR